MLYVILYGRFLAFPHGLPYAIDNTAHRSYYPLISKVANKHILQIEKFSESQQPCSISFLIFQQMMFNIEEHKITWNIIRSVTRKSDHICKL